MPMLTMLTMGLPVCPTQLPDRMRSGELGHPVKHFMHRGHDVDAVDLDPLIAGRAQRHVQDRTVLGDIDLVAGEHGVDVLAQAGFRGQVEQQPHRVGGDPVLGVVEVDPACLDREILAPAGVRTEQVPQMGVRQLAMMGLERDPRRPLGEG